MERWELKKSFRFEAAHHLPLHDGRCQRRHGHSWNGTLVVEGNKLITSGPKSGMVIDYADIKAALDPLVENYLDHWDLNETTGLANPTSEELARWIYCMLHVANPDLPIICVVINETCTSECCYHPV